MRSLSEFMPRYLVPHPSLASSFLPFPATLGVHPKVTSSVPRSQFCQRLRCGGCACLSYSDGSPLAPVGWPPALPLTPVCSGSGPVTWLGQEIGARTERDPSRERE